MFIVAYLPFGRNHTNLDASRMVIGQFLFNGFLVTNQDYLGVGGFSR